MTSFAPGATGSFGAALGCIFRPFAFAGTLALSLALFGLRLRGTFLALALARGTGLRRRSLARGLALHGAGIVPPGCPGGAAVF